VVAIFAFGFLAAWLLLRRAAPAPTGLHRPLPASSAPRRAGPRRPSPVRPRAEGGGETADRRPARLAIVVDDLGNDRSALARLLAIREPYTGAVLPGLPRSRETAEALARAGHEVLLHLPMEPVGGKAHPGPGIIRSDMNDAQLDDVLARDLQDVPGARGVNNHMGSKGTADPSLMDRLMKRLSRTGLYFLDSRTTEWTVAEAAAARHGVPFLSRKVFLDDVDNESAVERQLDAAVEQARRLGEAVAIGHPHPATLSVLERELPEIGRRGVTLVSAGDLLRTAAAPRP
jgi:polysaccharide deacetylase 2 family uncharacterized protein YibQ